MENNYSDYDEIPDIYIIGILDFIMPGVEDNAEVINLYSLRNDREENITLTDTVHYELYHLLVCLLLLSV